MPRGNVRDVTADANRVVFLKRKATALFNRVERLVDSLLSATLTSTDESGLHVRLELFDDFSGWAGNHSLAKNYGWHAIALGFFQNRYNNFRLVFKALITEILKIKALRNGFFSIPRELNVYQRNKSQGALSSKYSFKSWIRKVSQKRGASGEPCFRQFHSEVGIHCNLNVEENGFCHAKLCAGKPGGK